jgi:hypothetical protein
MNYKRKIIVISSLEKMTYFFTIDHCQNHLMGDDFIPCTHTIPINVEPREILIDGVIKNVKDLVNIFYDDMNEIPNPDKNMQPIFEEYSINHNDVNYNPYEERC